MERIKIFILLMAMPIGLWAQGQGLQLALKGGVFQWTGKEVTTKLAPMGGLDIGYTVRWRANNDTQLGLRSGLGLAYTTNQLAATLTDQYDRVDYYSNTIQYTTYASVKENHKQVQLDIPVLFSLHTHGFVLNAGPKLTWIASDQYTQTIDQANIDAYYPRYKVHVRNEAPTGKLNTPYSGSGSKALPALSLALSAEVGYEWQIGYRYSRDNEQYIGVQLYMDYGVWNMASKQDVFLSVAPITAAKQTPAVTTGSIPAAASLNYFNAGLRLYYTIQSIDYPGRGWHRYR